MRDGNTDHTPTPRLRRAGTAKERAERQSGQSTHARERNTPTTSVSRTLSALRDKAAREPEHRFRGLSRLLDYQMLKEAFALLKRKAAPGIDGMVHAEYAKDLDVCLMESARASRAKTWQMPSAMEPTAGSWKPTFAASSITSTTAGW